MTDWQPMNTAPMTGEPYLLGTIQPDGCSGVMFELWHWCSEVREPRRFFSSMRLSELKRTAPENRFFWKRPDAPKQLQ